MLYWWSEIYDVIYTTEAIIVPNIKTLSLNKIGVQVRRKEESNDQGSTQSSTAYGKVTKAPGNVTLKKANKSPDHKSTRNSEDSKIKTNLKYNTN